jgi:hypothetical protein
VPWCPSCDRYLNPSTVRTDGTCANCGRPVDPGRAHAPAVSDSPGVHGVDDVDIDDVDDPGPMPWHLKLLGGAVVMYLGYRAWQGIEWLVHQLS